MKPEYTEAIKIMDEANKRVSAIKLRLDIEQGKVDPQKLIVAAHRAGVIEGLRIAAAADRQAIKQWQNAFAREALRDSEWLTLKQPPRSKRRGNEH